MHSSSRLRRCEAAARPGGALHRGAWRGAGGSRGVITPIGGAIIGLALGLTREITEDGSILTAGSLLDLAFWTLGGLAAGILAGRIKARTS